MRSLSLFLGLILILTGCKLDQLQDASGKYSGLMTLNGKEDTVILEFPYLKGQNLKHKISLTFSSVKNIEKIYEVRFNVKGKNISLTAPGLGIIEPIDVKTDCNKDTQAICLHGNQITLSIKSPVRLTLDLKKIEKLPIDLSKTNYSKDELMLMAKFSSYEVQSEAIKTFQSFNSVKSMKGNLLPRINMGTVLEVVTDWPLGLVGAVGNLLPFVFPSNWFKVKAAKQIYAAEKFSFASIRGNEMNLVEGLYYLTQRDYFVLSKFEAHINWLKKIHALIKQEESDLIMPTGSALFFERFILEIEKDKILLNSGVQQELAMLAQSVGLPPLEGVKLLKEDIATLPRVTGPFDAIKLYAKARERSFEIKSIDSLIQAARANIKTEAFSILDPASSEFLGFGFAAQMRIARGEVALLEVKKNEWLGQLQEELVNLANKQQEYLDGLSQYEQLKKSQQAKVEQVLQMHIMGSYDGSEISFINDLIEESKELLGYEVSYASILFSQLVNKSKIDRLTLDGAYKNLDLVTPY